MWWLVILVAIVGVFIVVRGYTNVRKSLSKYGPGQHESWDAQMIQRLRAHGYTPFNEYRVDFFLALPDEAACQTVRARLEPEGFAVDTSTSSKGLMIHGEPIPEDVDLPLSLHASKSMRLIVSDIHEISKRMAQMAVEFHGRYDGWAA
jgi:hypothetical protein